MKIQNKVISFLGSIIFLCIFTYANANDKSFDQSRLSIVSGFPNLTVLDSGIGVVAYSPSNSTLINKKRGELDKSHQLYYNDGFEADSVVLLETSLSGSGNDKYYVIFSEGPSLDPSFDFVPVGASTDKAYAIIWASALVIPSNGFVYSSNRFNNMYTEREKYLVKSEGLIEVQQPYSYVGLKSKVIKPLTLYSTPDKGSAIVAQLPKGSDVEVLLTDGKRSNNSEMSFLVKTPFGLLGWVWIFESQYDAEAIEGISWWGD